MERDEILSRLRERIVAFAASRIAKDVAEDLAQEVLMVLHDKYPGVTRLEELLPLSLQILRFKMAGFRRRMHRRGEDRPVSIEDVQPADPGPDPALYAERQEMLGNLTAAIGKLGERCREMFRLKLLGKSFPEIQEILKAGSINTVYTWDARCRAQLLALMGGRWKADE